MSLSDIRLKYTRRNAGYESIAEFCRRFRLNENTYGKHESGNIPLGKRNAIKYADALGVCYLWLLTGEFDIDDIERRCDASNTCNARYCVLKLQNRVNKNCNNYE